MRAHSRVRRRQSFPLSAVILGALVATSAGLAQPTAGDPEFQVNTYTTLAQRYPSVAMDGQGGFVVVWQSGGSGGNDTDGYSIQGRRYDASGAPVGDEFQVNTYTTSSQGYPSVAMDDQGRFVVVWMSAGSGGSDTSGWSIQGQRYDAGGVPLGSQFQVNSYTTGGQNLPSVAMDGPGSFVVVWQSDGSGGSDTDGWSVHAQRYDASGIPLGGQFQVNTYTTLWQAYPAVAMNGQGSFVVAWESRGSGGSDTSYSSIQGQRYDATGTPAGEEFQVNTYTTDNQWFPELATEGQGSFVVVWHSDSSGGSDTSLSSIQGQRYDASGAPQGDQFQVNTYTPYGQSRPSVAMDGQGDFVVAWQSDGSSGSDTSYYSIQVQRYAASGASLGGQFQVNAYTPSRQTSPGVAMVGPGRFVVVWESWGSSGTDTEGYSIQGRRYDALFRDGFESGDSSRWSSVVP